MVGKIISKLTGLSIKKKPDNHGPRLSKKLSVSLQEINNKPTIFFVLGIRGSGKTSLLKELSFEKELKIIKPSTNREKRTAEDDEYNFVDSWQNEDFSWEVRVGNNKYGVQKSELEEARKHEFSFCVFDPSSIDTLKAFRESSDFRVLTIGLDTIDSLEVQRDRVSHDKARFVSKAELSKQREVVKNCDILLNGDLEDIYNAVVTTLSCLKIQGGVIPEQILKGFMGAGALLENTINKISPASYDLRLGDDVWCQGKFITLNNKNPVLKIPAYSYVIVSSKEYANLPCFISARFDLKNNLFFQGVILSNGPQIDPGYRGALFCMLYNGSDQPVGITRGQSFATIEFLTTAGIGLGYRDKYQGKTALQDFMPPSAAVSEGGKILERTQERIDKLSEQWKKFKNGQYALLGLILAVSISPSLIVYFNLVNKVDASRLEYANKIEEVNMLKHSLRRLESDLLDEQRKLKTLHRSLVKNNNINEPLSLE